MPLYIRYLDALALIGSAREPQLVSLILTHQLDCYEQRGALWLPLRGAWTYGRKAAVAHSQAVREDLWLRRVQLLAVFGIEQQPERSCDKSAESDKRVSTNPVGRPSKREPALGWLHREHPDLIGPDGIMLVPGAELPREIKAQACTALNIAPKTLNSHLADAEKNRPK